jgi:hypothetical protein
MQPTNIQTLHTNNSRKNKYRLNIRIEQHGQDKFFIKSTDSHESSEFLKLLIYRENLARQFFGREAEVVKGMLKENAIYYPYLPYPTLEDLLIQAIEGGDSSFGAALIVDYIDFIHKLPNKICLPEDFMRDFGICSKEIPNPVHCFPIAPIDCVPSNILIGERSWYIVDHEWTYEYPIPSDFITYRGIYSLVIRLQDYILYNISYRHPVVLFCGYGQNRTYIPCSWLELIPSSEISIKQFYFWEHLFQQKVNINFNSGFLRLKNNPKRLYCVPNIRSWVSILISKCSGLRRKYYLLFYSIRDKDNK